MVCKKRWGLWWKCHEDSLLGSMEVFVPDLPPLASKLAHLPTDQLGACCSQIPGGWPSSGPGQLWNGQGPSRHSGARSQWEAHFLGPCSARAPVWCKDARSAQDGPICPAASSRHHRIYPLTACSVMLCKWTTATRQRHRVNLQEVRRWDLLH